MGYNYTYPITPQLQQQPYYQQPQQYIPAPTLNGKIVDGYDTARCQDVPMGGFSVFPKADMSAVYIKSWNNDGTTKTVEYSPTVNKTTDTNGMDEIRKAIEDINQKLDTISHKKEGGK